MGTEVEVVEQPTTAIVPLLGLVVSLDNPTEVAQALQAVRDAKAQLDGVRAGLERVLADEAIRLATKTLHLGDVKATITGGPTTEYDMEVLEKLLDAGLPQERYDALVKQTVTYKVSKTVVNQLKRSGNERYSEIVEQASREVLTPYRVTVE